MNQTDFQQLAELRIAEAAAVDEVVIYPVPLPVSA
jgi:hypothetical protein